MEEEESKTYPVSDLIKRFNRMSVSNNGKTMKSEIRDEKEKLLTRLRLSREELDTYIRHSRKIIDEKRVLENENLSLRKTIEKYSNKISSLEKLEFNLRGEISQLLKLFVDPVTASIHKDPNVKDLEWIDRLKDAIYKVLEQNQLRSFDSSKISSHLETKNSQLQSNEKIISDLKKEISDLKNQLENKDSSFPSSVSRASLNSPSPSQSSIPCSEMIRSGGNENSYGRHSVRSKSESVLQKEVEKYIQNMVIDVKFRISDSDQYLGHLQGIQDILSEMDILDKLEVGSEVTKNTVWSEMEKFKTLIDTSLNYYQTIVQEFDKKITSLNEENTTLNREIDDLKYALTTRIELANRRAGSSKSEVCEMCRDKFEELKYTNQQLNKQLTNKQAELEDAIEGKMALLTLMQNMAETGDATEIDTFGAETNDEDVRTETQ